MQNICKFGLLATLHSHFLEPVVRAGLHTLAEVALSLEGEQGHHATPNSFQLIGSYSGRPWKLSAPFDHQATELDGEVRPACKTKDNEAYEPASKRPKLNNDFSLSVASSSPGPSRPHSSGGDHVESNQSTLPARFDLNLLPEENREENSQASFSKDVLIEPKSKHKAIGTSGAEGHNHVIYTGDSVETREEDIHSSQGHAGFNTRAIGNIPIDFSHAMPEPLLSQAQQENSPDEVYKLQENYKYWAWMSIILRIFRGSISNELETNDEAIMERLTTAYYTRTFKRRKKTEAEVSDYQHSRSQLGKLLRLLWAANYQILKNLGHFESSSKYILEQKELQDWFLVFISRLKHYRETIKGHVGEFQLDVLRGEELNLYQKIINAVDAKAEMTAYKLYPKEVTQSPLLVPNPEILMNEAIFRTLEHYYKTMSYAKWELIFRGDKQYIFDLARFGNIMNDQSTHEELVDVTLRKKVQSLIPWKAFSEVELMKSIPNYLIKESFELEKHVIPIFNEGSIKDMRKLLISINYDPGCKTREEWGWISRVGWCKKYAYKKLFQPTSNTVINEVKMFMDNFSRKNSSPEKILLFQQNSNNKIFEKLDSFFEILWALNERFLFFFRCEPHGEDYINDQKSVQVLFLSCFSENMGEESNYLHQGSCSGNKNNLVFQKMRDKILKLALELFTLEKNQDIFKVKNSKNLTLKAATITEEDLILGEMAAILLGYYYKNQNIQKYLHIFQRDNWFLKFLLSQISPPTKIHTFSLAVDFSSFKFLPWKDKLDEKMPRFLPKLGANNLRNVKHLLDKL